MSDADLNRIEKNIGEVIVQVSSLATSVGSLATTVDKLSDDVQRTSRAQAEMQGKEGKVPLAVIASAVGITLAVVAVLLDPVKSDITDTERRGAVDRANVAELGKLVSQHALSQSLYKDELDRRWSWMMARSRQDGYDARMQEDHDRRLSIVEDELRNNVPPPDVVRWFESLEDRLTEIERTRFTESDGRLLIEQGLLRSETGPDR